MITTIQQEQAAKDFAEKWAGKGDEKQDSQRFWIELLQKVYGVDDPASFVRFETRVKLSHTSFIDVMIPATHTMIEQKGRSIDLEKPIKQSDGTLLKPSEQAKRYAAALPYSDRPRWIVACNFRQFQVFDMERPNDAPQLIELADLPKEYYRLQFIVDVKDSHITKEMEISKSAGDLVGRLYKALHPLYLNAPQLTPEKATEYLNKLCVRLVFCLYAEDAGVFGKRNMFHDYLADYRPQHFSQAISILFKILDTKIEDRDPFLEEGLAQFPYVNGSLFRENVPVPPMNEEVRRLILEDACNFDWSQISPTIFGAIFEDTLNSGTRRAGGMHYTSIENIHKVIDPLFLDAYKDEFHDAMQEKTVKKRTERLKALQQKLAAGRYFDPACGSGNFLTESYLSLRRLENDILRETIARDGSILLGFDGEDYDPIKVSIQQFYGIEINDFAVSVAKTAIWIAESQMMKETEGIIQRNMDFLPLHTNANIHEGNALRMDWKEVLPPSNEVKIMGNPPFSGFKVQSAQQRDDMKQFASLGINKIGLLDYVCGWYIKAADYINGTNIEGAFVSTNSISQGEQPAILWDYLYKQKMEIFFAYRTFNWTSESKNTAKVHCIIIGFCAMNLHKHKILYDDSSSFIVDNITPYIAAGKSVLVQPQKKPLSHVPNMIAGNKTVKCLALILSPEERATLISRDPKAEKYIKKMIGAKEFINNIPRYCLWLVGVSPKEIKTMPEVYQRVQQVRVDRLNSKDKQAQVLADSPATFRDTNNPDTAIVVPLVSSQKRRYIPIGYIDKSTIANNKVSIIPNGTMYQLGILCSNVHNAWMRRVAMRMKSDYSYSLSMVYNTFPWPTPTDEQKAAIEKTAQGILDARALYPDSSLADLYDEVTMPKELREAHRANDRAVMRAYGFSTKMTEADCVAALMKMYEDLTSKG